MSSLEETKVFNQNDAVIEGWYWALKSSKLNSKKPVHLNFLGRELALYRGEDGIARAVDAYCPHMGAHLAEGNVDGKGVRCFFHGWKFDEKGDLVDIPCRKSPGVESKIKTWPCQEKYGMIWIYTGEVPRQPVPFIYELKNSEVDASFGNEFVKECHPNVVMINAIDAHHFTSVHNLPVEVKFETIVHNDYCIAFENRTTIPHTRWYLKLFDKFYEKYLTYKMCYWNGSTGSVTVGPDFLHCHIIFALRPLANGHTEGQTILVTPKRKGVFGAIVNPIILWATKQVGNYFAKGDTEVFKTINFKLKTPIKEDDSIIKFLKHTEKQKTCDWGFGKSKNNIPESQEKDFQNEKKIQARFTNHPSL